jgi:predicted AlkP superfamily phosphohydrolase/phosphomutase
LSGLITTGVGGILGALSSFLLPRRGITLGSWLLPIVVIVGSGWTLIAARVGPGPPRGELVEEIARIETGQKVAILGIDGLDWTLINEAIAEGRLPHLSRILENGVSGDLRSIRPPKSPVVWTSIATGMLPEVHGIRDFLVRREGERIPVTGNLRRSPALWNMAYPAGFTVAFLNWYVTWPAEAVPGVMVSDRVDFDGLEHRVSPEPFTAVIDSIRTHIDSRPDRSAAHFTRVAGDFEEWRVGRWGQVRRALGILDDVIRHDLVTLEATRVALRSGQPDLTALYFRGNDNTQHLFWKYRLAEARGARVASLIYEDLNPSDVERLAAVIDRYYDFVDRLIGEVLELLEPDTALLVISDHGFLTNNERSVWYHPNRLLEAGGLAQLLPGTGGVADADASVVFEPGPPTVSPARMLRPGGRAERPREALGEAKRILSLATTERGERVFDQLLLSEDEQGLFLRATFSRGFRGDSVDISGRRIAVSDLRVPEGHSGDHAMDGLLLGAGPPFRRGEKLKGARAVDIAPTVLHLLGAPAAQDMEGVVLERMLDPAWAAGHPVRLVRSYGPHETGEPDAISTEADERIRDELRALGYIQ